MSPRIISILIGQEILLTHVIETSIPTFSYLGLMDGFLVFHVGNQSLLHLFICHSCCWMPTNILSPLLFFTERIQIYFGCLTTTTTKLHFPGSLVTRVIICLESGLWDTSRNGVLGVQCADSSGMDGHLPFPLDFSLELEQEQGAGRQALKTGNSTS